MCNDLAVLCCAALCNNRAVTGCDHTEVSYDRAAQAMTPQHMIRSYNAYHDYLTHRGLERTVYMGNLMRDAIERGEFVITCEMIPGRGAGAEPAQIKEFAEIEEVFSTNKIHAISITDNPGGNPAIAADAIAKRLHDAGICTLTHFTCKDKSRNQLQAQLYAMEANGLQNVLVMTGDYQYSGWNGRSKPVFDLDPVQSLALLTNMNAGLEQNSPKGQITENPTHFYAGAVVSPFKWTEAETITQYLKLEKKILSGANYIISQLGYDARKMQELIMYVREKGYDTPIIANIYLVSAGVARYMKGGNIPGCYMSDEFLQQLTEEAKSQDKGREARYLRAAKMIALARGLGYSGVHIGGVGLNAQAITRILDLANTIQDDWRSWAKEISYGQADGFYLYEPELDKDGQQTGLNTYKHAVLKEACASRKLMKGYGLSRLLHHWVLTPNKRFFGVLSKAMDKKDRKRGVHRHHGLEHLSKTILYGCMDCGDCGLETAVYTCPMTQCPKSQRNGPCGGSSNGWCEVYPKERYCIYYKAYHRLKKYNELEKLDLYITPPNNWDYYETSSWSNYTHKRDNAAHREFLPAPQARPQVAKDKGCKR